MPWIKIDDRYAEHPKFARAGPLGVAMWLAGLAYCNRNLTDGFIPWPVARSLVSWEFLRPSPEDASREIVWTVGVGTGLRGLDVDCAYVIDLLLEVGLWDEAAGGYRIHDYGDFQPSKADVLAERSRWAEEKRRRRLSIMESVSESVSESAVESSLSRTRTRNVVKEGLPSSPSLPKGKQGVESLEPRARPRRSPTNGPVDPMERRDEDVQP